MQGRRVTLAEEAAARKRFEDAVIQARHGNCSSPLQRRGFPWRLTAVGDGAQSPGDFGRKSPPLKRRATTSARLSKIRGKGVEFSAAIIYKFVRAFVTLLL